MEYGKDKKFDKKYGKLMDKREDCIHKLVGIELDISDLFEEEDSKETQKTGIFQKIKDFFSYIF